MCNFILSKKREGGEWRLIMNELTLSPKCQLCKMLHHHKLWGESVMLRPGSGSGPGSHYVAGVRRGGGVTWYPARWKHLETSKVTVLLSSSASKSSIRRFVITEKAPTRAFSWLKAATTAFTFKTLLRHYAKRALTPRSLNMKLGPRRNYHKGWAAIRHYANQTARPLW